MKAFNNVAELKEIFTAEIEKHATGEIKWNVANQFDEHTLERATEKLNDESFAEVTRRFKFANPENVSVMDVARIITGTSEGEEELCDYINSQNEG